MSTRRCDFSLCEKDWAWGGAGECSDDRTECDCSFLTTGADDWFSTTSCHVVGIDAFVVHFLAFLGSIIGAVLSFVAVILMLVRYFRRKNLLFTSEASKDNDSKSSHGHKLKRDILIVTFTTFLLSGTMLLYYAMVMRRVEFEDNTSEKFSFSDARPGMAIIMWIFTTLMYSTYLLLIAIWYYSLPSVKHFGSLVENSILVKHPLLTPRVLYSLSGAASLGAFFILVVMPEIYDEEVYMRTPTKNYIIFAIILHLCFIVVEVAFIRNIRKTLVTVLHALDKSKEANEVMQEGVKYSEEEYNTFKKAIKICKILETFNILTAVGNGTLLVIWRVLGGFYQYFFFTTSTIGFHLLPIVVPILMFTARPNSKKYQTAQGTNVPKNESEREFGADSDEEK